MHTFPAHPLGNLCTPIQAPLFARAAESSVKHINSSSGSAAKVICLVYHSGILLDLFGWALSFFYSVVLCCFSLYLNSLVHPRLPSFIPDAHVDNHISLCDPTASHDANIDNHIPVRPYCIV